MALYSKIAFSSAEFLQSVFSVAAESFKQAESGYSEATTAVTILTTLP
jgi:hypothetical protein